MTGPGTSAAIGSGAALAATALFGNDGVWIALFGGFGGFSRWLYFALNGHVDVWYKAAGQILLSMIFVVGTIPIATPILTVFFSADLLAKMAIEPGANLGIAYLIGVFTTVLIGLFEDRIASKKSGKSDE